MRQIGWIIAGVLMLCSAAGEAAEIPWDRLPNVDQSKVTEAVRKRAEEMMKKEACYHECEDTVYNCLTKEAPVSTALRLGGFIVRQVIRGKNDGQIRQDLTNRARSVHPFGKPVAFRSLRRSLSLGAADAPVRVVIYADLDCPFCRVVSPLFRELLSELGGKVAYFYMLFPVKVHGDVAIATSKASIAAADQGKFWEFHDIMYRHFEKHSDADILKYVEELGMDMERFQTVWRSPQAETIVEDTKAEGLALGVKSTPTVYINGKLYHGERTRIELLDVLQEELELVQKK